MDIQNLSENIKHNINLIPKLKEWKTFTLATSNMPQSISEVVKTGACGKIRRNELDVWNLLISANNINRSPLYADYGVTHPDYIDYDPRTISKNLSPTIRYTMDDSWLIIRGTRFQQHPKGYKQYHDLSHDLITRQEFLGENFSWADNYINKCANKSVGSGGLKEWVTINTNHHITFVANQVANFPSS